LIRRFRFGYVAGHGATYSAGCNNAELGPEPVTARDT
jgi:hypothetical protein